jgi:hypothetical protein
MIRRVARLDIKGRVAVESIEKRRRLVALLELQIIEMPFRKEVIQELHYRPAISPAPTIYEVVASSEKSSAVIVA